MADNISHVAPRGSLPGTPPPSGVRPGWRSSQRSSSASPRSRNVRRLTKSSRLCVRRLRTSSASRSPCSREAPRVRRRRNTHRTHQITFSLQAAAECWFSGRASLAGKWTRYVSTCACKTCGVFMVFVVYFQRSRGTDVRMLKKRPRGKVHWQRDCGSFSSGDGRAGPRTCCLRTNPFRFSLSNNMDTFTAGLVNFINMTDYCLFLKHKLKCEVWPVFNDIGCENVLCLKDV